MNAYILFVYDTWSMRLIIFLLEIRNSYSYTIQ